VKNDGAVVRVDIRFHLLLAMFCYNITISLSEPEKKYNDLLIASFCAPDFAK